MERGPFGGSAAQVSRIGLGCANLSPFSGKRYSAARDVVRQAMDRGITFFDTADTYGVGWSERWLGRALGSRREQVMIATKCGLPASFAGKMLKRLPASAKQWPLFSRTVTPDDRYRPAYIESALVHSLKQLGTDYVDVLMLHSPPAAVLDDGSWAEAMVRLRDRGLVRYFGISARTADDAARAIRDHHVDCVEIECNPCTAASSDPVLSLAASRGTAVIARQAFGSGRLLDAVASDMAKGDAGAVRKQVAAALRQFVLERPAVSVLIVGMSSATHLADNTSPSVPAPDFVERVAEAAGRLCAPARAGAG